MNKGFESVIKILPERIAGGLKEINGITEEIRIKPGAPVYVYSSSGERLIYSGGEVVYGSREDISYIIRKATGNSVYAYDEDIKNGFITIENGHRIGICGKAVYENKKLICIKEISALNIRCANQLKGVGDELVKRLYPDNVLKNTLIISPPKCGKTTVLRDMARILSEWQGMKIAIIDERDEIAASSFGKSANDVGSRTFVMSGYLKEEGFSHAVRALSPTLIICDEIGGREDFLIIEDALLRGVKIIASLHGDCEKKLSHSLVTLFERVVFLNKSFEFRVFRIEEGNFIEC